MRPASRWTLQVVVTSGDTATDRAALELRLSCWLERVARLIARRDTPRGGPAPGRPGPAADPRQ
jgi:hypothetical protein